MADARVLTTGSKYPITPEHIDTKEHFFDAFGKTEVEDYARLLVKFARSRGHWGAFAMQDLDRYLQRRLTARRVAGWFLGMRLLVRTEDEPDLVHFTRDFVASCFRSSPCILDSDPAVP